MTNIEASLTRLKRYLESRPAFIEALSHLREFKEVGFRIAGANGEGTIYRNGDRNQVELRGAHHPDFIFILTPECVHTLLAQPGLELADMARFFVTQLLMGGIKLRVRPRMLSLVSSGYLSLMIACSEKITLQSLAYVLREHRLRKK